MNNTMNTATQDTGLWFDPPTRTIAEVDAEESKRLRRLRERVVFKHYHKPAPVCCVMPDGTYVRFSSLTKAAATIGTNKKYIKDAAESRRFTRGGYLFAFLRG